jgi:hypothetical protein
MTCHVCIDLRSYRAHELPRNNKTKEDTIILIGHRDILFHLAKTMTRLTLRGQPGTNNRTKAKSAFKNTPPPVPPPPVPPPLVPPIPRTGNVHSNTIRYTTPLSLHPIATFGQCALSNRLKVRMSNSPSEYHTGQAIDGSRCHPMGELVNRFKSFVDSTALLGEKALFNSMEHHNFVNENILTIYEVLSKDGKPLNSKAMLKYFKGRTMAQKTVIKNKEKRANASLNTVISANNSATEFANMWDEVVDIFSGTVDEEEKEEGHRENDAETISDEHWQNCHSMSYDGFDIDFDGFFIDLAENYSGRSIQENLGNAIQEHDNTSGITEFHI